MKTPELIKKGLEYCSGKADRCMECPYPIGFECFMQPMKDALAYIQQLESSLEQAERERDAAVSDMYALALNYESSFVCDFCGGNSPLLCEQCKIDYCGFKWRGICAENTKEENE